MKLLIADDSRVSRTMLFGITNNWGYDVIIVEDGKQAWDVMQEENPPQLLLLDWEMPHMNGIEVCERVIAQYPENPPYIILLTSRTTSEDIVKGLSKGANDYLSKPFDSAELQVRLKVGKRMIEMQNKLNQTLIELKEIASHDSLTGILNRRSIMEHLAIEIKRTQRQNETLYIGMCDIDHFKRINDTYGHVVGDEVIKEVTVRMKETLREHDLIGRYGGEEFLLITPINTPPNAEMVYQRICSAISEQPIKINALSISVTVSCGITEYKPNLNSYELSKLIDNADKALYKAKDEGRNKVILFR